MTFLILLTINDIIYQYQMKQLKELIKMVQKYYKKLKEHPQNTNILKASLLIAIVLLLRSIFKSNPSKQNTQTIKLTLQSISNFYSKLKQHKISNVVIGKNFIQYRDRFGNWFSSLVPARAQQPLEQKLISGKINYSFDNRLVGLPSNSSSSSLWIVFGYIIIYAGIMAIFYYFMFMKNQNEEMKTNEKPMKAITFDSIIGLESSKIALIEVIDFMKNPTKYSDIGARMRKGIIFYGPSGTGKTTLAKAAACEANVPFYSCNASEFCEIYVGTGPKRVKDLFRKAKQTAPSIIYIDQIDAVGNRKGMGLYSDGAGSEKNSTINQLLSEMDGFSSHETVLVIGSTNRLEMIDSSLLRAGRFDLKIKIGMPTKKDRYEILKFHLSNKKHNLKYQFLEEIVQKLQWSGADLQNLANQSVYTALRNKSIDIRQQDLVSTLQQLENHHKQQ